MGSYSEIVEISSEEEDNSNKLSGSLGWMSGSLDEGSSDDQIFMDGISISIPQKNFSLDAYHDDDDEDDDDCKVLDCDPDKPDLDADFGKGAIGGGADDDELEIVSEKGQIACRDFPHARHLCANFPFNTTPHDQHCKMCHCYVCDSPAPCAFWGNTTNSNNHCHATDKDSFWKNLRNSKKLAPKISPKISNFFKPDFDNPISQVTPLQPVNQNRSYMPIVNPNPNFIPNPNFNPNPDRRVIPPPLVQPMRTNTMRPCVTSHRVSPYQPIRTRHLSRSSSMQPYSSKPGYPSLNPSQTNSNSNSNLNPILNRSLSASETYSRMCQNQILNNPIMTQNNSMQENKIDTKRWQDICDSLASELGVPNYSVNDTNYCVNDTNTSQVQQPVNSSFLPVTNVNQMGGGVFTGTSFQNNITGTSLQNDITGTFGDMNVNSQGVSVSSLYDFEGNWGGSAPI